MTTYAISDPERARLAPRRAPTLVIITLYAVICLIWGTTWLGIKVAVTDLPPMLAAGLRFLVAVPILVVICRLRGAPLMFPRHQWWFGAFVTIGYFAVPYFLINEGEQYISSGLAAICFATVSVLIVLISVPVLGTTVRPVQLVAVVVAFAALALLVAGLGDLVIDSWWGVAAMLGAATMHSFAYVMIKKHGSSVNVLTLNTVPMALAGLGLLAASTVGGELRDVQFTPSSAIATLYLGVVASALGFLVYFWLLQQLSAMTMSFIFVIFPVLAQFFAVTVEGTPIRPIDLILTLVILGAFAVVQVSQRSGRATPTPAADPLGPVPGSLGEAELAVIFAAAERAYPEEACGFVRVGGVRVCPNAVESQRVDGWDGSDRTLRTGYAFGPADLLELNLSLDSDDPVTVIFHSHPDVGAYFSAEDERHALLDGEPVYPVDHVVVDVVGGVARGARHFRFDRGAGYYVESLSYGSPGAGITAERRDG